MSSMHAAGAKQERDVVFHLKRTLADASDAHVFHNIKIEHNGENAQIDHLVLHRYGFVVIESKSIYGEVKVNDAREWSRSYQGKWYGMPSPVQQARAQIAILKEALREQAPELLGRILGIQQGFGGRAYDVLVAVSSSAIIHRDGMPAEISDLVVKSEFLPEALKKVIKKYGGLLKTDPDFNRKDMGRIAQFLAAKQVESNPTEAEADPVAATPEATVAALKPVEAPPTGNTEPEPLQGEVWKAACKHCGSMEQLDGRWGKFGYYVACPACEKNTPLKRACPKCEGNDTRLKKSGTTFALNCSACGPVGAITTG